MQCIIITWRPARASSGSPAPVVQPRADASAASTCVAVSGLQAEPQPCSATGATLSCPADDDLLAMQQLAAADACLSHQASSVDWIRQ